MQDGDDGSAGPQSQTEAAGVVWLEDRALSEPVWPRLHLQPRPGGLPSLLLSPRHLGRSPLLLLSVSQPARVMRLAVDWEIAISSSS